MEKILLSGGAGYLGSTMVGFLLNEGYQVTVLDNLMYNQWSLWSYLSHPNFDFVRGDVRNEQLVKGLLQDKDAIIWLAAIVGAGACDRDPILATSVNLESVRMLNRLRSKGQRVLWPCTNSGYGTRSGAVHCTEETPLEPISLYGRNKVEAEQELLGSPNTVSFRLATVFGPSPRMRYDLLVNDFVLRSVTDRFLVIYEKDFKRNYIHVEDVASCFLHGLKNFETMKGQAYNAGLDEANLSKAELAELIKSHVPELYVHYAAVGSDPDKRNYIVSNAKLRAAGFSASRSVSTGVAQLVRSCRMLPLKPTANN
ncbi:MAG: SDR family oxidoreductase [Candidatus Riflebacteria bacterium]|nr:SDR family oxidoreductase [Candidatus Riflebacteria bacterium]